MNKTTKAGIELIKKYEGLRLKAYLCPAGVPTIGYGSTRMSGGRPVNLSDYITIEQAEEMLRKDLLYFEDKVMRYVTQRLYPNQFDAVVSFTYNLGEGNLKRSTLLRKINSNPIDESIGKEFLKWNKANVDGELKELQGLTNRRKAEADMYFDIDLNYEKK